MYLIWKTGRVLVLASSHRDFIKSKNTLVIAVSIVSYHTDINNVDQDKSGRENVLTDLVQSMVFISHDGMLIIDEFKSEFLPASKFPPYNSILSIRWGISDVLFHCVFIIQPVIFLTRILWNEGEQPIFNPLATLVLYIGELYFDNR